MSLNGPGDMAVYRTVLVIEHPLTITLAAELGAPG
jgi:hypothetical protein